MATNWANFIIDFLGVLGKLAENTWSWLMSDITFDNESVKVWQLVALGGLAAFVLGKLLLKAIL